MRPRFKSKSIAKHRNGTQSSILPSKVYFLPILCIQNVPCCPGYSMLVFSAEAVSVEDPFSDRAAESVVSDREVSDGNPSLLSSDSVDMMMLDEMKMR